MNFKQWLKIRENVYRIDPEQRDFSQQPRHYFITPDGQSGPVPTKDTIPDWGKNLKGVTKTGLYAGNYSDILSYLVPRELPWILEPTEPKKTLYVRTEDVKKIQEYRPWISSFDKNKFQPLSRDGQGEFFSEMPPKPIKQIQIPNPLKILQQKFNLVPVKDIKAKYDELISDKKGFDSEGEIFM